MAARDFQVACDHCDATLASVFCHSDGVFLCEGCDVKVHSVNKIAQRHVRVPHTSCPVWAYREAKSKGRTNHVATGPPPAVTRNTPLNIFDAAGGLFCGSPVLPGSTDSLPSLHHLDSGSGGGGGGGGGGGTASRQNRTAPPQLICCLGTLHADLQADLGDDPLGNCLFLSHDQQIGGEQHTSCSAQDLNQNAAASPGSQSIAASTPMLHKSTSNANALDRPQGCLVSSFTGSVTGLSGELAGQRDADNNGQLIRQQSSGHHMPLVRVASPQQQQLAEFCQDSGSASGHKARQSPSVLYNPGVPGQLSDVHEHLAAGNMQDSVDHLHLSSMLEMFEAFPPGSPISAAPIEPSLGGLSDATAVHRCGTVSHQEHASPWQQQQQQVMSMLQHPALTPGSTEHDHVSTQHGSLTPQNSHFGGGSSSMECVPLGRVGLDGHRAGHSAAQGGGVAPGSGGAGALGRLSIAGDAERAHGGWAFGNGGVLSLLSKQDAQVPSAQTQQQAAQAEPAGAPAMHTSSSRPALQQFGAAAHAGMDLPKQAVPISINAKGRHRSQVDDFVMSEPGPSGMSLLSASVDSDMSDVFAQRSTSVQLPQLHENSVHLDGHSLPYSKLQLEPRQVIIGGSHHGGSLHGGSLHGAGSSSGSQFTQLQEAIMAAVQQQQLQQQSGSGGSAPGSLQWPVQIVHLVNAPQQQQQPNQQQQIHIQFAGAQPFVSGARSSTVHIAQPGFVQQQQQASFNKQQQQQCKREESAPANVVHVAIPAQQLSSQQCNLQLSHSQPLHSVGSLPTSWQGVPIMLAGQQQASSPLICQNSLPLGGGHSWHGSSAAMALLSMSSDPAPSPSSARRASMGGHGAGGGATASAPRRSAFLDPSVHMVTRIERPDGTFKEVDPERAAQLYRYRVKRNQRLKAQAEGQKKIRYECRRTLAGTRQRVKGRFAKTASCGDMDDLVTSPGAVAAAAGNPLSSGPFSQTPRIDENHATPAGAPGKPGSSGGGRSGGGGGVRSSGAPRMTGEELRQAARKADAGGNTSSNGTGGRLGALTVGLSSEVISDSDLNALELLDDRNRGLQPALGHKMSATNKAASGSGLALGGDDGRSRSLSASGTLLPADLLAQARASLQRLQPGPVMDLRSVEVQRARPVGLDLSAHGPQRPASTHAGLFQQPFSAPTSLMASGPIDQVMADAPMV